MDMTIFADWALMKMIIKWDGYEDSWLMLVDAHAIRIGILHRELCYADDEIAYQKH